MSSSYRWVPPSALIIGCIYEVSFWSVFNVNILSYLNIADLVRLSVGPLIALFPVTVVTLIILSVLANATDQKNFNKAHRPPRLLLLSAIALLAFATALVALAVAFHVVAWWSGWISGEILVVELIALVLFAVMIKFKADIFPPSLSWGVQISLLFLLISLPFGAWWGGHAQARMLVMGWNYSEAVIHGDFAESIAPLGEETKFLRHVNAYDFFLVNGEIVVVRADELPPIRLIHHSMKDSEVVQHLRVPLLHPKREVQ